MTRATHTSFFLVLSLFAVALLPAAAHADAGDFDTDFSTDGVVTADNGDDETVAGVEEMPDGSYMVAGTGFNGADNDLLLARFTEAGVLDATFGVGGIALYDPAPTDFEFGNDVTSQTDGKLIVVGSGGPVGGDLLIARFNTDGTLDATFSGDGVDVVDMGGTESGESVFVQADGDIIVGGTMDAGGSMFVARYDTTGVLDAGFAGDGILEFDPAGLDDLGSVAAGAGNTVWVFGWMTNATVDMFSARITAAGALDGTWGVGGIDAYDLQGGGASETANDGLVQSNGRLVLAGTGANGLFMARRTTAGAADATFDGDGEVEFDQGAGIDELRSVIQQTDGKLVTVGEHADGRAFVARRNTNGSADTGFATTGIVEFTAGAGGLQTTGPFTGDAAPTDVITDSDGRIVVAGTQNDGGGFDILLARFIAVTPAPPAADDDTDGLNLLRAGTRGKQLVGAKRPRVPTLRRGTVLQFTRHVSRLDRLGKLLITDCDGSQRVLKRGRNAKMRIRRGFLQVKVTDTIVPYADRYGDEKGVDTKCITVVRAADIYER